MAEPPTPPTGPPEDAVVAGVAAIRDAFAKAETKEPCPLTFLGHRRGRYYVVTTAGEVRSVTPSALGKDVEILDLFGGSSGWLWKAFPRLDKEGEQVGWQHKAAGSYIMRMCAEAGLYDDSMPMRGVGVWRHAEGGVIAHLGSRLMAVDHDGLRYDLPVGRVHGGALYEAAPRIEPPATQAATAEVGRRLQDALRLWNYATPAGAEVMLGWIGAALLGGAPSWRAHLYTVAPPGSGKSGLADLVKGALGAQAHDISNDVTEPGLRQAFNGTARGVVYDEAEADNSSIVKVVAMLRRMSSGEGVRTLKGSTAQVVHRQQVTGQACLFSVLHPPFQEADWTRIAVVRLGALRTGVRAAGDTEAALDATAAVARASPALRARALEAWPRFLATLGLYRADLLRRGCSPRQADQAGTFLAGRDLLIADDLPHPDTVTELVDRVWDGLVTPGMEASEDEGEGPACLRHLLTQTVETGSGRTREPLSHLIAKARERGGTGIELRDLQTFGLRVLNGPDPVGAGDRLFVVNRHSGLARLFAGTKWADGVWKQALLYLPEAKPGGPHKVGGVAMRGVELPAPLLPGPGLAVERAPDAPPRHWSDDGTGGLG